jgi:hypothetical protein
VAQGRRPEHLRRRSSNGCGIRLGRVRDHPRGRGHIENYQESPAGQNPPVEVSALCDCVKNRFVSSHPNNFPMKFGPLNDLMGNRLLGAFLQFQQFA